MSYQYQLISNIGSDKLFNEVLSVILYSHEYIDVFLNSESAGFKLKKSESDWISDIEIHHNNEGVFLDIHTGNAKKLLKTIDDH